MRWALGLLLVEKILEEGHTADSRHHLSVEIMRASDSTARKVTEARMKAIIAGTVDTPSGVM